MSHRHPKPKYIQKWIHSWPQILFTQFWLRWLAVPQLPQTKNIRDVLDLFLFLHSSIPSPIHPHVLSMLLFKHFFVFISLSSPQILPLYYLSMTNNDLNTQALFLSLKSSQSFLMLFLQPYKIRTWLCHSLLKSSLVAHISKTELTG